MSQISKCPKITVVLSYWEALGEVSELSYKSLLYSTSVGSYCNETNLQKKRIGNDTSLEFSRNFIILGSGGFPNWEIGNKRG